MYIYIGKTSTLVLSRTHSVTISNLEIYIYSIIGERDREK